MKSVSFNFSPIKKIKRHTQPTIKKNDYNNQVGEQTDRLWAKRRRWEIDIIKRDSIIEKLEYDAEKQLIAKDIITELEGHAVEVLSEGKDFSIPYFGTIKMNKGRYNIAKHKEDIRQAKALGATNEELKEMAKKYFKEGVDAANVIKDQQSKFAYFKRLYKEEYDEYYKTIGKAYAEMFIYTLTLLEPIEFNPAFEEAFNRINNQDNGEN